MPQSVFSFSDAGVVNVLIKCILKVIEGVSFVP
jgi:hypothetical protein